TAGPGPAGTGTVPHRRRRGQFVDMPQGAAGDGQAAGAGMATPSRSASRESFSQVASPTGTPPDSAARRLRAALSPGMRTAPLFQAAGGLSRQAAAVQSA